MSNDNDKDQEYQKNMGKRLRKIRKENALSQDDVSDALGICTKQYQRYMTAICMMSGKMKSWSILQWIL